MEAESEKTVSLSKSGNGSDVNEARSGKFPLTVWEVMGVSGAVLGLLGLYFTMSASDHSFLKLPRTLQDLQILRDDLESYTRDYTLQVLVGYNLVYIFMQTFMIPGTVFMSLLAGALFGVVKGVVLVVFAATAGITLGELQSVGDLYDIQSIAIMFVIGVIRSLPRYWATKANLDATDSWDPLDMSSIFLQSTLPWESLMTVKIEHHLSRTT